MIVAELDYERKRNVGRILLNDKYWLDKLAYEFSAPNPQKKFVKGIKKHWVKDRTYFIRPTGYFNFGLAEQIVEWLKANVDPMALEFKFSDAFLERYSKDPDCEPENNLKFELREYQHNSVKLALKYRFGTFVLGTGAGKTFTIACIIDNLLRRKGVKRAMILVPDNNLVLQFHDELINQYGLEGRYCLFYDKYNEIDPKANIIIANRPLFLARFEQNKKFFREQIDCLVVDEAHSIKKSNKVSECVGMMRAWYRFGFTGTLAEEPEDKFKTLGLLGKVRYEKTSKSLRDAGFLTPVTARLLNLNHPKVVRHIITQEGRKKGLNYQDEVEVLQKDEKRNKFLANLCLSLNHNTLILVNRLEHGFNLEQMLKDLNVEGSKKIYFIRGEIEATERDEVRRMMEDEDDIVCVAITKIFSTGINIKNLHNVIFAAGGKSAITVVQAIGRGLRLHANKKRLNIFDIADVGYTYSMKHREKRVLIYKKEQIPTKLYDCDVPED